MCIDPRCARKFGKVAAWVPTRKESSLIRVWVDIDNAPHVQYLLPLAHAFERVGAEVVVTARDRGITLELLRERGTGFHAVGSQFGKSKVSKVLGLTRRAHSLISLFRAIGAPDVLVSSSRPSVAAAKWMAIPAFILCDYEHVHLGIDRWLGSTLLFPDVINRSAFKDRGFPDSRLIPFRGLKEDITFAEVSLNDVEPYKFTEIRSDALTRVLFRPPAEESHYHTPESGRIALELLEYLATESGAVVVFAPRYDWQSRHVLRLRWRNEPVLLRSALPFLSLLTAVDLVISGGGTMLREAAYLGVPAYSLFRGATGDVDRYLESIGRLSMLRSRDDFPKIQLRREPRKPALRENPRLPEELVEAISARLT
jgi:predicted glycosyltransferase